jgi:hypothetical protein
MTRLLVNTSGLHGKHIVVTGFLAQDRGALRLFQSEDASLVGDLASSIRVTQGNQDLGLREVSGAYVTIIGTLDAGNASADAGESLRAERYTLRMRPEGREAARKVQNVE